MLYFFKYRVFKFKYFVQCLQNIIYLYYFRNNYFKTVVLHKFFFNFFKIFKNLLFNFFFKRKEKRRRLTYVKNGRKQSKERIKTKRHSERPNNKAKKQKNQLLHKYLEKQKSKKKK